MKIDKSVLIAFACSVALILIGSIFFPKFLSVPYLLQQLHIASFLGLVAGGAMVVILLGQIDLSVPWTVTAAAIGSTAVAGTVPGFAGEILALITGLAIGMVVGLLNGVGAAFIRVHSMIWTLAMNFVALGACVLYTGGFQPPGEPSRFMRFLGVGRSIWLVPNAVFVWLIVSAGIVFYLYRTRYGRYTYAFGNSEKVTYLSGIRTRRVLIMAFLIAGTCNAIAGMMLSGYANMAYQAMGDPYLLPAIASVVLGGT
jgi:ribose transport system permease protein